MWRSLRDRRAATPVRGQRQGHPVDSPRGCPPAAPTPAHRLPRLPHISTAGGLAAAIGATTLIFFNPFFIPGSLINLISGHVTILKGYRGPSYGMVSMSRCTSLSSNLWPIKRLAA